MDSEHSLLKWVMAFLIVGLLTVIYTGQCTEGTNNHVDTIEICKIKIDTVYKIDTLVQKELKVKEIKSIDTLIVKDTLIVREQKTYEDSLYTAWVSGYDASLDSIKLYRTTSYVNTVKTNEIYIKKNDRLSFGLQAGYGYPHGAYIGLGINYRFFVVR